MDAQRKDRPASILTRGHLLARNTFWNLTGQAVPLIVAVFAIPPLVRGLGTERFGVLMLAWTVIGYFNLFDLGLGRALTKLVAERLGAGHESEIPAIVWTALAMTGVMGIAGTALVAGLCPWLVQDVLKIPIHLQAETLKVFYLLAFSIPIVLSSAGLRGILEAHQCFGLVNAVRIPLGIFTFLGPLAVLPFSNSLFPVLAVLVAGRLLASGVHVLLCLRLVPALRHGIRVRCAMVKPLLSFGSWMTVSNIIGPLMVYMDRFLIGATVSMVAVAYYATPYEVVTKLWLIPGALVGVLFPAFSATFIQDRARAAWLFGRGISYVFLALFPLALIIVTLAHEGLEFWLGTEFADNSSFVLQWLAVGVFINSLARVASGLIQGAGRPDLAAKTHLIELPFYLLLLWWLLGAYGIAGAAIAWVVRVAVDTVVFFAIARWLLPGTSVIIRRNAVIIATATGILIVAGCTVGLVIKGLFLIGVVLIFILVAWFQVLASEERVFIKRFLRFGQA